MVRVKHRGTSATVPAAGVSTIGKLRVMIRAALELPPEGGALRIIYQGRELSDPMQTLEAAGVTDASTVMVSFQDTPGGPPVGGWEAVRGPLESISRKANVQSAKVHAKLSVRATPTPTATDVRDMHGSKAMTDCLSSPRRARHWPVCA